MPIHTLSGIVCFGQVSCSPPLMGFCAENNVGLSYLTEHGEFLARIQGPVNGNVLLRREQYRRADSPDASASLARAVVQAKLANCRTVLLRAVREYGENPQITGAVGRLARNIQMLEKANSNGATNSVDAVRGVEGDGARNYFCVFDHLITTAKEHFLLSRTQPPAAAGQRERAALVSLHACSFMTLSARWRGWGLIPRWGSCIATARAAPVWRSI